MKNEFEHHNNSLLIFFSVRMFRSRIQTNYLTRPNFEKTSNEPEQIAIEGFARKKMTRKNP